MTTRGGDHRWIKRSHVALRAPFPGPWTCALVAALVASASPVFAQQGEGAAESKKKKDDLSGRLIRKAVAETDEDLMEAIIRLMNASARRVEIDFDTSEQTQALQRSITEKLDEAIAAAAMQRRPRRRSPDWSNPDKRRMPKSRGGETSRVTQAKEAEGGATGEQNSAERGAVSAVEPARGDLIDVRRGWGHLPARQREEMIQGIGENYLERYRVWIERYYRALQELEE
ncbi:MAG: hypothetical protein IID35_09330 [Planctomycetes bacterium]|nr:hypothetical protein [Planctomycetota bacterium]